MAYRYIFILAPIGLLALLGFQTWNLQVSVHPINRLAQVGATVTLAPPAQAASAPPSTAAAPAPLSAAPKSVTKVSPVKPQSAAAAQPTSDIAPADSCPGQNQLSQYVYVLICMTSYARQFHGLNSVTANAVLGEAASEKASDIIKCDDFSHTACGHPSDYWITTKGYKGNCSAENIGQGQNSPAQIFVAWMNSAGHRANILRAGYFDIGLAEQSSSSGPLWVMELGGC